MRSTANACKALILFFRLTALCIGGRDGSNVSSVVSGRLVAPDPEWDIDWGAGGDEAEDGKPP